MVSSENIWTDNVQAEQVVLMCVCVCVYVYICVATINEKSIFLKIRKTARRGTWEGLEGGKGENDVVILISKSKRNNF